MDVTLVLPDFEHPAVEERFAHASTELALKKAFPDSPLMRLAAGTSVEQAAAAISTPFVVVVTDPLISIPPRVTALIEAIRSNDVYAAVAATSDPASSAHIAPPTPYLTLRQHEVAAASLREQPQKRITWSGDDPVLFAIRSEDFKRAGAPLQALLNGRDVIVVPEVFVHRFASQRGQLRNDLLDRVDGEARRILEFGCGEGALGAALKARQQCRVVGIELDPAAASVARTRLDHLIEADVRTAIETIDEHFDFIIGGDIVEHLDDPWSFLAALRRVTAPKARLLLSLPNVANWAIIKDLLAGRFDYTYLGILCAGHLRFYTKRSIEELLTISGWKLISIEPQEPFVTEEFHAFTKQLVSGGVAYEASEIATPGWYVLAEN